MEKQEREIDTRLGRRVVDMERVIHFPQGLVGFEEEREFVLLQLRPEAAMLILQSMKTPQLGLLVADPFSFLDSFKPVVGEAEMALLQLANLDEAAILVTVSIPNGQPDNATLNLAGPIVINHQARIGIQVPQNTDGPSRINMHTLEPAQADSGE